MQDEINQQIGTKRSRRVRGHRTDRTEWSGVEENGVESSAVQWRGVRAAERRKENKMSK